MVTRPGGHDIVDAPDDAVRANSQIPPKVAVSPKEGQVKGPLIADLKTVVGPDQSDPRRPLPPRPSRQKRALEMAPEARAAKNRMHFDLRACSRPGVIVSATLPTRHWMWPWRSAGAPGSLGSQGSRPEAPAGWLRCRQGANFPVAAGVTGVKKLTRLPSGSRNRSERLPHGIVVGSLTKSSTNPARF
jgi:hypothetical protein